jgi:hypothetical protein
MMQQLCLNGRIGTESECQAALWGCEPAGALDEARVHYGAQK